MITHNIRFKENWRKLPYNYHQILLTNSSEYLMVVLLMSSHNIQAKREKSSADVSLKQSFMPSRLALPRLVLG